MKYLALFVSSATLLCCALPALLVFFGFGAVVASLVSTIPLLVTLSEYKVAVFIISATLIGAAWLMSQRVKECPIDAGKDNCNELKLHSRRIIIVSTILWSVGFSVAFILPRLLA